MNAVSTTDSVVLGKSTDICYKKMLPEHMVNDYNPSALSVRRIKGLQDIVSKRKSGYGGRKQINPPPCPGLIHWTQKSTDFIILNHYRNIRFFFFFK